MTYVTVQVAPLDASGAGFSDEFLVDSGSIDCMAPAEKLLAASIRPEKKRIYELADGSRKEYDVGYARISFLGDETITEIVFSPTATEPLLGAVALENTGYIIDPVSQTLKKLDARPLKNRKRRS